jgi:hypothetical protein
MIYTEKGMYDDLCESDKVNITIYSNHIRNDNLDFSTKSKIKLYATNQFSINPGDWNFFQIFPTETATNPEGYGEITLDDDFDDCLKCSIARGTGALASLAGDIGDKTGLESAFKGFINAIKKTVPWVIGVIGFIIIIFILKIFLSR